MNRRQVSWHGYVTLIAAVALMTALQRAVADDNPANNSNDKSSQARNNNDTDTGKPMTAGEARDLTNQASINLKDAISTAEKKTGGKTTNAMLMKWHCVSDAATANPNGDVSQQDLRNINPESPVAHVITVGSDGQVAETIVCLKSGKVLSTKQVANYDPGQSAYYHSGGGMNRGMASGRFGHHDRWNKAPRRWQKVTDLMKKPLYAKQTNEHIGEIKDLAIDPDAGRLMYTVVEFYGKLGHGDRWFAIPFTATNLSEDYKTVTMDYSTSKVNNSEGFDHNNWPNMTNESWAMNTYKAYEARPYWRMRGMGNRNFAAGKDTSNENQPVGRTASERDNENNMDGRGMHSKGRMFPHRWQKATDLIGKTVRNPNTDQDLGNLKDIVVDPDSGRILYGVLSFGGFLGLGDKLFAIPWSSLDLASDYKTVTLNVDKSRLNQAQGFDESHWPNMSDERWATGVYDYYNQPRYWERPENQSYEDDEDNASNEASKS